MCVSAATSAAACPRGLGRAEGDRVEVLRARLRDHREAEPLARDQGGGFVDQRAHRRDPARADDPGAGDERAEPVREVDQLAPGDAGEEVLVPAREPDDLVREDRAEDQREVVVDDGAVDADVRGVLQHPVRQLGDPLGADRADLGERRRLPPRVVEHGRAGEAVGERAGLVAQVRAERRLRHLGVRAERDEHGQLGDAPVQRAVDGAQAAAGAGRCACCRGRAGTGCGHRGPSRRGARATNVRISSSERIRSGAPICSARVAAALCVMRFLQRPADETVPAGPV